MKHTLSIALFGTYQVKQHGETVEIKSAKSRALLAYLAVEADRVHTSETLADLLWSKGSPGNLDQEILTLRKALALPDLIRREKDEVRLNPPTSYWLDVAEFTTLLAKCEKHKHEQQTHQYPELCQQCAQWRRQAIDLYRGDFLKGLSIKRASPEFDSWVQNEQDRLRTRAVDTLHKLATYHEWRGELELAKHYVQRELELEPWREEAHQQMMRLLSHSGQRTAALAQYDLCCRILADELGIEPSIETTTLYKRILAIDSTQPHNLPPQPARIVGRQQELADTASMLAHPHCRLLTIVGLGGIGKTRLSLEIAEMKVSAFLDGICFVPLAGLGSANLLVTTIADALGFSISGIREPKQQLLNYLRHKEMLLLLDNFEHLLDGTALINEILKRAPGVKFLITSRARLNLLSWEWVFDLDGLAVPAVGASEQIEHYSAVQLFIQHAKQVQHHFSLNPGNVPAIARLCQIVQGMPLALELAASWVRVLSCREIVAELEQSMDLLASSSPENPERHRSIRAVFEHSWQLLSANEQKVLCRLSVFQSTFSWEATAQVTGATLPVLSTLVDRSLVRLNSAGRYEMHELLRQFAIEKLSEIPELKEQSQAKHCDYYATFVQRREEHLSDSRREEALNQILIEIENVRAAWQWAVMRGRLPILGKFLKGISSFYKEQDWFWEGEEALSKAVAMLETVHDAAGERAEVDELLGMALAYQADFCAQLAFYEKAQELAHRSIAILRDCGAHAETAFPIEVLGYIAFRHDEYASAKQLVAESLEVYRQNKDKAGMARCLNSLGILSLRQIAPEEAARQFQQSLNLFSELGARREIARVLNNVGGTHWVAERHLDSQRYRQQGLALYREINDQGGIALCLAGLASTFYYLGRLKESIQCSLESLVIRRQTGDRFGEALTVFNLGRTSFWMGEYEAADQYHQQSLAMSNAINARWVTAHVLNWLGELAIARGNYAQAAEHFEASHALFKKIEFQTGVIFSLANLGGAVNALGKDAKAEQLLWEALAMSEKIGYKEGIALSKKNLAMVSKSRREYKKARSLLEESYLLYLHMDHRIGTVVSLYHIADVALALQDYSQAEQQHREVFRQAMSMQTLPVALSSLVGMAMTYVLQPEEHERAGEILSFVIHHHASTKQAREDAWCLLTQLGINEQEITTMSRKWEDKETDPWSTIWLFVTAHDNQGMTR